VYYGDTAESRPGTCKVRGFARLSDDPELANRVLDVRVVNARELQKAGGTGKTGRRTGKTPHPGRA
jgi:hypothetical protein